jgi:hypothetical protein
LEVEKAKIVDVQVIAAIVGSKRRVERQGGGGDPRVLDAQPSSRSARFCADSCPMITDRVIRVNNEESAQVILK